MYSSRSFTSDPRPFTTSSGRLSADLLLSTAPLGMTHNRAEQTSGLIAASSGRISESRGLGRMAHSEQVSKHVNATTQLQGKASELKSFISQLNTELMEVAKELDSMTYEMECVQNTCSSLDNPKNTLNQCLNLRARRPQSELINDDVSAAMADQSETLRELIHLLNEHHGECASMKRQLTQIEALLKNNLDEKQRALGLDEQCLSMNAVPGAPAANTPLEWRQLHMKPSSNSPHDWQKTTRIQLGDSLTCRRSSALLRKTCLEQRKHVASAEKTCRAPSMNALKKNISLYELAESTLTAKLTQTNKQISSEQKTIDFLEKSLQAKENPLSVAQSRLGTRSQRPLLEQVADEPEMALSGEVQAVQQAIDSLKIDLNAHKQLLQQLQQAVQQMNVDLDCKTASLNLDRQALDLLSQRPQVLLWYECLKY